METRYVCDLDLCNVSKGLPLWLLGPGDRLKRKQGVSDMQIAAWVFLGVSYHSFRNQLLCLSIGHVPSALGK